MRTLTLGIALVAALSVGVRAADLADYRDDFQGTTPATGWSYLWNAPLDWDGSSSTDASTNPLGTSANYVALQWSGSGWTADGDDNNSNGAPANFLRLHGTGGHPGRGSTQDEGINNTQDRAPIGAYTIQPDQAGPVYLTNTIVDSSNGGHSVGQTLRVQVYLNDTLVTEAVQNGPPGNPATFDAALGNLSAGDTVYVALSPDSHDGSDGFSWDYTLSTVANSTNGPIHVADLVDDYTFADGSNTGSAATFANLGTGWSYLWNAPSDWDGTASSDASDGDITSIADFEPLVSSSTRWTADGDNDNQNGAPANYLNSGGLSGGRIDGHTGRGFNQTGGVGNDENRYVIYAYEVETDGHYKILDSSFSTVDDQGDGNNVRVFTSLDAINAVFDTTFDGVTNASFDIGVGHLSAGDVIYVAVGPGSAGSDGNDSYRIDYSIAAVPVPAALPAGLVMFGAMLMRRRGDSA